MQLSTRVRYGARALVEVAVGYPEEVVAINDVARRLRLSGKYLEQIMSALKSAGLVAATRGMRGGYRLTRPPASISLRDVFYALDGPVTLVRCVGPNPSCPQIRGCPLHDTWNDLSQAILSVLEKTTLQELVERRLRAVTESAGTYHI